MAKKTGEPELQLFFDFRQSIMLSKPKFVIDMGMTLGDIRCCNPKLRVVWVYGNPLLLPPRLRVSYTIFFEN